MRILPEQLIHAIRGVGAIARELTGDPGHSAWGWGGARQVGVQGLPHQSGKARPGLPGVALGPFQEGGIEKHGGAAHGIYYMTYVLHRQARVAFWLALPVSAGCTATTTQGELVGAWRSQVQFSGGAFAAMKDLEFMYVFNAGGTLTESSNYDGAPPVPPAYGVWREVGPKQYEARYLFYTTKAPARLEDMTGGGGWLPAGHGVFTERIRLDDNGKSFESTITYEAFDQSGKPVAGGGDATGHAVRIDFRPDHQD